MVNNQGDGSTSEIRQGKFQRFTEKRYAGWDTTLGRDIEKGKMGFSDLETYTLENGEPAIQSGRQEMLENMLNDCLE